MAYDPDTPPSLITQGIGGPTGLRWFALTWIDPIADVLEPGYISNADLIGMRPGDGLIYKDVNRGEWDHYDLICLEVAADGSATVAFPEVPEEAIPEVDDITGETYFVLYYGGRQVRVPRDLAVPYASQPEAEAGVLNDKGMTPLRTRQEINVFVPEVAAPFIRQPEKYGFSGAAGSPIGLVDSRAAINAAINAAANDGNSGAREVIIRGKGFIGLSAPITPRSGVRLVCDGDVRFIPLNPAVSMIDNQASDPSTYTPLTVDGGIYKDRVVVGPGNTVPYVVGNYVTIRAQTPLPAPVNSQSDKCAQIAKIVHVDATTGTLHLDRSLFYDYLVSATAEVAPLTVLRDASFENFKWGLRGDTNNYGARMFDIRNGANLRFLEMMCENNRAQDEALNPGRGGITLANVIDSVVDGFQMTHVGWYGVSVGEACYALVIRNGEGHYMRHVISLVYSGKLSTGGGYGEPGGTLIENVQGHYCDYAAIDTHDTGWDTTIRKCKGVGGQLDTGIQIRSRQTRIEDCETHGNRFDGVGVESGAAECSIDGLRSTRNRRSGVNSKRADTKIKNFNIADNGDGSTSGRCGISVIGGEIISGRLERNDGNAILYTIDGAVADQPLHVERVFAERVDANKQNRFISISSGNSARGLTLSDNELKNFGNPFEHNGKAATDASEMIRRATKFTSTANPVVARTGRVTLTAGAATVAAPGVYAFVGAVNIPAEQPNILLRFLTPGATEERLWVSSVTSGTGFNIKSSDAASTRVVLWEIVN